MGLTNVKSGTDVADTQTAGAVGKNVSENYLRCVSQELPEPNRACLVGVYAVTLDPYFPYME